MVKNQYIKVKVVEEMEGLEVGEIIQIKEGTHLEEIEAGMLEIIEEPKEKKKKGSKKDLLKEEIEKIKKEQSFDEELKQREKQQEILRKKDNPEKKSYYEIQLDALNSIENLKDKKNYIKKIDFSKKIEKNSDASIISEIRKFQGLPFKEFENGKVPIENFLIWVEKFNSYIVNVEEVAKYFTEKYSFKTVSNQGKEKLFVFDGKIYSPDGEKLIKEEFEKLLEKYAKINPLNEVIAKIKRQNYISLEEFDSVPLNLIPLENGVFNLETRKLENHSPKNYFKTIVPIKYDSAAKCEIWLSFLKEALYPEDIPVIQKWFGFNLYRKYLIKKALIVLGPKDTGKTVLLNTLIDLVGEKNKTGLSLQKLSSGSDFVKLSLKDKYSNIYDDLSSKDLNDGGNFKIATGGGFISAEEKFGGYYQFKSYAKQTFATNKIPPVKDNDDMAYFSRWIVIRFDNIPEKKDLFLGEKIKSEVSGILNWALEGLFRLLEKGEFSYDKTDEEIKTIMEMSGDPLIQFGEECLSQSENKVSKEEMYEVYRNWANKLDKPLLSKEQLGRRLNQKVKYLVAKTGAKERFWDNVSIKEKWMINQENNQQTLNLDTLDTSKKIMRKCPEYIEPSYDIIFSKPSNPSKNDNNTLDTSKEEIDFSKLNLEEELNE